MLRIGEFSSITGISIDMLRNYDKIGLLIPEFTDPLNGYRYYNERQIVAANYIRVLKGLGFGLKEIASLSFSGSQNDRIKEFLRGKIAEKEIERIRIEGQVKQMQQALQELDHQGEHALAVTVKHIPARKVASLREVIHKFHEEGRLWKELHEECHKLKVRFAEVDFAYAITHELDFDRSYMDVEVQCVVERTEQNTDRINFFEVAECDAAVLAFQGQYDKLGDIKNYMLHWIESNGYQIEGLLFMTYYVSPGNEANPENYITEVCIPIKKI